MPHQRLRLATFLGILLLSTVAASAQNTHTYSVGLMVGLGGSTEGEPDTGLDNFGWQASFSMAIDISTLWGVRVGQMDLGSDVSDSELAYVTLGGEYRFGDSIFDSGIYLGLGLYDFDGGAARGDDSALGAVLGVTGDIGVTDRFSVLLEVSGHYADLDQTQFFLMGHVGLGFRF